MNKILVVDDEQSMRIFFADELTEEGYDVITCGERRRAAGLIRESRPDLVILDIKPGEDNGLELLQDIRDEFEDLPIILCTAYPSFGHDPRSVAAQLYVLKSSNLDPLKRKVQSAIQGFTLAPSAAGTDGFSRMPGPFPVRH